MRSVTTSLNLLEKRAWGEGISFVAGVDEVGRGPLAGPVMAAAVIFPEDVSIPGIKDSKELTAKRRESLYTEILKESIAVGVGEVDEKTIDKVNILQATYMAMRKAIANLKVPPQYVLVDGFPIPGISVAQLAVKDGESKSISIAAASIVAKVTRDRLMISYDKLFPCYGFASHKGYPTKEHKGALLKYGICEIHRQTFKPVKMYLGPPQRWANEGKK